MRKTEEVSGDRFLRCCKAVLLGGVFALCVCLIFLFLASIGVSQGLLDPDLRYQLTVVACVLGGFTGGLFAVRRCPAGRFLTGLAVGGVLFLMELTLGLLIYDTMAIENGGTGLLCGALCGGAAAGILGRGPKEKRRPARRRSR
ncbi:MAG: TIGR04086 family membrane protein [Clostridiales bacterium]|nr:TIGR04086 family membrane protein [Clostridiales bacterium]